MAENGVKAQKKDKSIYCKIYTTKRWTYTTPSFKGHKKYNIFTFYFFQNFVFNKI